jgi:hypothetical protein
VDLGFKRGSSVLSMANTSFICLSSAASLDVFPKNTATSFTNLLPRTLTNKGNKTFHLRLKAIGITTRSADPGLISTYLKIHIYELQAQREGLKTTDAAGGFAFPPLEKCSQIYAFHTFRQAAYLPTRFQQLDSLRIKIVDAQDKEVELLEGPPTLVWLEITDMEQDNQFSITCVSSQPHLYPNNTLSNFTTPLSSELNLTDHEVALLHLVYPPGMTEGEIATLKIDDTTFAYDLNQIRSTVQFLARVKVDIFKSKFKKELAFGVMKAGPRKGHPFIRRTRLRKKGNRFTVAPIMVNPSPNFTKACGQLSKPKSITSLYPGMTVFFTGNTGANIFQALTNPVAMLCCDIVQPNVMCGQQARLLQCVPVFKDYEDNVNRLYEPEKLAYHAVPNMPFNSITLKFVNPDGRDRNFDRANPEDSMIATLLFRHKKK